MASVTESWTPKGGWNRLWSESEKEVALHLFQFFRNKKYPSAQAEVLLQMWIWKQKYPTLRYTEEQEEQLRKAMGKAKQK